MNPPYLKNRITTKWWQDLPIGEDIVEKLAQTVYYSPSKQNYYDFRCIIITDSEQGKSLKKDFFLNYTWSDANRVLMGPAPGLKRYNGQYLAPLLFVWLSRWTENPLDPKWAPEKANYATRERHTNIEVGISSGAVMTTAESMGLNTGFGLCHDSVALAAALGHPQEFALLALGVGYAVHEPTPIPKTVPPLQRAVRNDRGSILGFDLINLPAEMNDVPHRVRKPAREDFISVI